MIKESLNRIELEISEVANKYAKEKCNVLLLPVTKRQSVDKIKEAYDCGYRQFGENYLQEAIAKIEVLPDDITWHFIGSIQSKKSKLIVQNFDWVHTVASIKVATKLNKFAKEINKRINICLQINIDDEESKSGYCISNQTSLDFLLNDFEEMLKLENICIQGLMCIQKFSLDAQAQNDSFERMNALLVLLNEKFSLKMKTLSMGMSDSLEMAIKNNASIVRVGSDIFGARV